MFMKEWKDEWGCIWVNEMMYMYQWKDEWEDVYEWMKE